MYLMGLKYKHYEEIPYLLSKILFMLQLTYNFSFSLIMHITYVNMKSLKASANINILKMDITSKYL